MLGSLPKITVVRHEGTVAVINLSLCTQGRSELSHFFLGCLEECPVQAWLHAGRRKERECRRVEGERGRWNRRLTQPWAQEWGHNLIGNFLDWFAFEYGMVLANKESLFVNVYSVSPN